jgi:hypothetical protein
MHTKMAMGSGEKFIFFKSKETLTEANLLYFDV